MPLDKNIWPFVDPPNVAVLTIRQIMNRLSPILLVHHHEEDGAWEFLTVEAFDMADVIVVGLEEIVQMDSSVLQLSDLPLGWQALRASTNHIWVRTQLTDKDA